MKKLLKINPWKKSVDWSRKFEVLKFLGIQIYHQVDLVNFEIGIIVFVKKILKIFPDLCKICKIAGWNHVCQIRIENFNKNVLIQTKSTTFLNVSMKTFMAKNKIIWKIIQLECHWWFVKTKSRSYLGPLWAWRTGASKNRKFEISSD